MQSTLDTFHLSLIGLRLKVPNPNGADSAEPDWWSFKLKTQ